MRVKINFFHKLKFNQKFFLEFSCSTLSYWTGTTCRVKINPLIKKKDSIQKPIQNCLSCPVNPLDNNSVINFDNQEIRGK
jgi:hypothetical protein